MDLVKERETFIRSFLRRGVEVTEAMFDENAELRDEAARLRGENAQLRAQLASDDAIRDLLKTVEDLQTERSELLGRSAALAASEQQTKEATKSVERDLSNLANLYIATFQLHASLSPRRVLRHVRDLLGQLVGADAFVIYLVDKAKKKAIPLVHEGVEDDEVSAVDLGDGPVGEACLTGIRRIEDISERRTPVAIIPMQVDGRTVGIVEIRSVLPQKEHWLPLDHELLDLIQQQAAIAMIASNLYDPLGDPFAALAGYAEKQSR